MIHFKEMYKQKVQLQFISQLFLECMEDVRRMFIVECSVLCDFAFMDEASFLFVGGWQKSSR